MVTILELCFWVYPASIKHPRLFPRAVRDYVRFRVEGQRAYENLLF